MKVLKATLAFVMGLVLGIILLVLAIGGTVVALGTTRTVGELQSAVTDSTIISPDSELYGQTVLEAVQKALKDYQNFDNITLKLLYERYGINLLKGISGLDFTQKSFYDTPITDIINDLSILLDDIYLSDIGEIADLDFLKYNIPIIDENMNVGLTKAIDNIMNLVNGDLSIRLIQSKLGLNIGVDDNDILKALQDVNLKSIGGLIDALRIGTLLTADTDSYLFKGSSQVYLKVEGTAEEWEEVSEVDLKDPDYKAPLGVETYIAGGDADGNLIEKEMRYYKYEGKDPVVDNSCYNEGWTCPDGATVLRHRLYKPFDGDGKADGTYYIPSYANRIEGFDALSGEYSLLMKDFASLDDIFVDAAGAKIDKTLVSGGKLDLSDVTIYYAQKAEEEGASTTYEKSDNYSVLDDEITENSLLRVPEEPTEDEEGSPKQPDHPYIEGRAIYFKSYNGTSSPLLQYLNYLSIGHIRKDTDSILKNVRIGDIIDTDAEGVAEVLKALKDSTLDSIGKDINGIPFGKLFGETDNKLLNAIKDFTLSDIGDNINNLKLGDIMDVTGNSLLEALQNSTLQSIGDDINGIPFGKLFGETDNKLLNAIKDFTLNDIGDNINNLKLGDIMDVTGNPLLEALQNSTLDSIGTDINNLKIGQIIELTEDSPRLLHALDKRGCTLNNIGSMIDELTVGELLEVAFDEYEQDDANGNYIRVDIYVDYNEYLDSSIYGEGAVRGNYNKETGEFTPDDENGTSVKTYYYALYDQNTDEGKPRYKRTKPSDTALAVQSLARRGVKALEMGDYLDELSIGELMRVDEDASRLFKTLARKGSTLNTIAKDANDLEIADIIDIDSKSPRIMQSLRDKHCKIGDMGTIIDKLTLDEIIEISDESPRIMRSLRDRHCTINDLGTIINELTLDEIIEIDGSSSKIMRSLRDRGCTIRDMATIIDDLTLDEIIDIDDDASRIMKSLRDRGCKIKDMATITDQLTLSEILEIVFDKYVGDQEKGIYVHVTDSGYVPYDGKDIPAWRTKYVKSEDGSFVEYNEESDAGKQIFEHSAYYTLYNPAEHNPADLEAKGIEFEKEGDEIKRFVKQPTEGASSKILQRFSGATMGTFSNAFNEIMLSDVMDIDADIYALVNKDDIVDEDGKYVVKIGEGEEKTQVTAYYYDANACVYRIANEQKIKEAKEGSSADSQLYYIAAQGGGTAILRKLAFVKVSKLESAMNAVMQDLMLSEIIEVYKDDAVIAAGDDTPSEDGYYFIEWDKKTTVNGKPAVYVYDDTATGKYFLTNFYDEQLFDGDPRLETTEPLYYVYESITTLNTLSNLLAYQTAVGYKLVDSNLYIKDGDDYVWNLPYASYLVTQITLEDSKDLYYRKTDGVTKDTPGAMAVPQYSNADNLYVMNVFTSEVIKYSLGNPALDINANKDLKTSTIKAPQMKFYYRHQDQEADAKYFAPIGDSRYDYTNKGGVKYGAQYCNDVYFKIDSTEFDSETGKTKTGDQQVYVFNGVGYDEYNKTLHAEATDFYIKKLGYVASFGEAYYSQDGRNQTTLTLKKVTVERQRSSSVLRLLADKTINEMNDVIKTATMGDFIEITPGTIFDNDEIRSATITNLGKVLSDVFTNMTIGELLGWSNITGVQAAVAEALNDVTLTDFFKALKFEPTRGGIIIDMSVLYGHTA